MCYGGCRFQGQVVSRLPGSCFEYFQRVRKQLVECTLRASSARFLEVGYPYIYCGSLFTNCFHRYDFFQTLCSSFLLLFYKTINLTELFYSYRWWPDPFGQHGSRWVPKSYSYFSSVSPFFTGGLSVDEKKKTYWNVMLIQGAHFTCWLIWNWYIWICKAHISVGPVLYDPLKRYIRL